VAVTSSVVTAIFLFIAGIGADAVLFPAALFVAGAADGITDVAQNAHGLRVQRAYGRSIINSLHAVWSAGAMLGGLMGAAAIALHIPRVPQLAVSSAGLALLAVVSYRFLLRGPDHADTPETGSRSWIRPSRRAVGLIVVLALLAIAGAAVEDAGSSWATVYLHDTLDAPAALAVFGFIGLVSFQFIGRLVGDRLVDRFGERAVVRIGGVVTAAGMGTALAVPTVPGTIAGFAMAGFGVATVVPAAFHGADTVAGLAPGSGLTVVTWLMRVGFLGAPAIVGAVADAAGLRVGLLIVPVAGLLIALGAAVLPGRVSAPRPTVRSSGPRQ